MSVLDRVFGNYIDSHYSDWRVETGLRYVPIAKDIERIRNESLSILDVGSGASGIYPYLRRNYGLVGLDADFTKDSDKILIRDRVVAQSTRIPFPNKSFDIVVCLDVLEHVPPELRTQIVRECLRAARKTVYIGFPSGEGAHQQDVILNAAFLETYGVQHYFLAEHLLYPLPTQRGIEDSICKSGVRFSDVTIWANQNLRMRGWLMMWGFVSRSRIKQYLARRLILVAFPLLEKMNQGTCYRTIFRIELEMSR